MVQRSKLYQKFITECFWARSWVDTGSTSGFKRNYFFWIFNITKIGDFDLVKACLAFSGSLDSNLIKIKVVQKKDNLKVIRNHRRSKILDNVKNYQISIFIKSWKIKREKVRFRDPECFPGVLYMILLINFIHTVTKLIRI